MTPCEEKGWKTGDWFLALSCQDYFEEGEEIYLSQDDGSRVPQFSNGKDYWYLGLSAVEPLSEVAPLKTQKGTQTHTSRNGVTVKTGDKVLIIGSDNKHWKNREGLIGVVEFRDGEARVVYEDARPWVIYNNTDIEKVEGVEVDDEGWIANQGTCPYEAGTKVDIKHGDGDVYYGLKALVDAKCYDWSIGYRKHPGDITHYRLSEGREELEEEILPLIEDSEGNLYVETGIQEMHDNLADQLEEALAALSAAQREVDRLQTEYREAYPLINGIRPPQEDMSDPVNWKRGS